MARIPQLLQAGRTHSFEFFPPRTADAEAGLEQTLVELEPLHPAFVSVTYGAGGSTRERTHDLVVRINDRPGMTAMAHLTCVGHTRAELEGIVTRYRDAGVENILALGGDAPADLDLPPGDLTYAVELVRLVRATGDFAVGVAAHPEPHPRSPTWPPTAAGPPRSWPRPTSRSPSSSSRPTTTSSSSTPCGPSGSTSPSSPGSCRC